MDSGAGFAIASEVNDFLSLLFHVVPRYTFRIHFLDFVHWITFQVASGRSREHLVQYRRAWAHGSRHFCLQHGVRIKYRIY